MFVTAEIEVRNKLIKTLPIYVSVSTCPRGDCVVSLLYFFFFFLFTL